MHDMAASGLGDLNRDDGKLIVARTHTGKKFRYEPIKKEAKAEPGTTGTGTGNTKLRGMSAGEDRKPVQVNSRTSDRDATNVITPDEFEEQNMQMLYGNRDFKEKAADAVLNMQAAADEEPLDKEIVALLVGTTDVERADLIEELTRKAFVLLEAGEIKEAQEHLGKATKIAETYEKLQEELTGLRRIMVEEPDGARQEGEVLVKLRKELAKEDFLSIFGGDARFAHFIGQW